MSSNCSDGHLGFMQIRKVPQSCHSGKRWIWILEHLSNTNQSKKLTVPNISWFTMGHPQLATRLECLSEEREVELNDMWQASSVLYEVISKEYSNRNKRMVALM